MPVSRRGDVSNDGPLKRPQNPGAVDGLDRRKLPFISMAEVKKHSTASDCWMVIHGGVYDVQSYLQKHPGGAQIMLKYAGMDATLPFDDVGHSMESLIYDLPPGSLKGLLDPRDSPLQHHIDGSADLDDKDEADFITMAHDRSRECRVALNRFYTVFLYTAITICVSLLLYMRLKWHSEIKTPITLAHKIQRHVDGAFASPDTHPRPREEEFGIPAWAY